jgi:outer membrane protein
MLFLVSELQAQEIHSLNFNEAIKLAKKQNLNLVNANYDRVIAQKKIWETTAQGLPQVNSSLSYNNNLELPVTLVPAMMFDPTAPPDQFMELQFGVQHNAQFNLQVSQLVFNGSYIVGLQTAKTYKELSERAYDRAENEVIKNTSQAYYGLLFSIENRKSLKATLLDMERTYKEIKKTVEVGLAEETTADQIMLNKLTLENAINNIDRQIQLQYDLIKIQLGIDVNDSIQINDSLTQIFNNTSFEQSLALVFSVSENPDFKVLESQEELDFQNVRLQKSMLLPSVNAFFSHSQSGFSDEFSFFSSDQDYFPSSIVGASINIPITTSGGTLSKIKQAELELQKTKNNKYLLEQNLLMGAQQAKDALVTEFEAYNAQKKNLELAERIYKRALEQFRKGMLSSSELTQLNTQYYNTQSAYHAAMLNVLNAYSELSYITGK